MSGPVVVLLVTPIPEKATETRGDSPGHRRVLYGMDDEGSW